MRWKSVNTIQWNVFTYRKLFLSLNGKTSQQTKHSSLAIAKCSMMSSTCNVVLFVQYEICTMQKTWTKNREYWEYYRNIFSLKSAEK